MLSRLDRERLLKMGMRADDFTTYGFGVHRPLAGAPDYLGYSLYRSRVRPALNAPWAHPLTENKWVFYRLMESFGVPVPETLGLYHPMFGVRSDGGPLQTPAQFQRMIAERRPSDLVIKPSGGHRGHGVLILRDLDAAGACRTEQGQPASLSDVVEGLSFDAPRGYPGHVVQVAAEQHGFLREINPHTTNTVRVMTLVTGEGVLVHGAVLRLGRDGRMADNWDQGAVGVAVDVDTGRLGEGVLKPKHGGHRVTSHPDTDVVFTGQHLPRWDEVLDVCRRAAVLLPGVRSVGWDVLLTEDGPVLIEANGDWGLHMVQVHTTGLLADARFRRELEAAGVRLPTAIPGRLATLPRLVRAVLRDLARRAVPSRS